jgi:putative peptidoglycan lipid II flippase
MLRVFAIQIPIYGLTVIAQGTLHAHRRFVAPALAPLLSSTVVIAVLLAYQGVSDDDGSLSALSTSALALLSWGTTLGVLVLLLTQWPSMAQLRLLVMRPSLRFPESTGRPAVRLAAAGAVTVGAQWLAFVIGLRLANDNGDAGSALTFLLVWTVFLLPWAVLAFPIATSVFPQLSALYENNQPREFADTSATSLRAVTMAGALGAAGVVALASPLANVMLVGAPGVDDTSTLRLALQVSAGAVFGYAFVGYLSRVLFARHSSRSAALVAGGGWLVTAVAAFLVVPQVAADDVVIAIAFCMSSGLFAAAVLGLFLVKAAAGKAAGLTLARQAPISP